MLWQGGVCRRLRRGKRGGCARGGKAGGEVTTARYVYPKPVIKNVSARAVCRPVIIQLKSTLSPFPEMQYVDPPAQQVRPPAYSHY